MPTLYIRGEIGATLDETRRTLASINAVGGTLKYASLAPEELAWRVKSANLTASDTIIPDNGQAVSLYLDETRIFRGHVTGTEVTGYGVTVRVAGPWWWLERQEATSEIADEEANTAERAVLEFPSQGWDQSIVDLMDLAETGFGLPVTVGTVPTFNDLPVLRYKLSTIADVLTRLISWCGDAVAWWDHGAESGDCQAAGATSITLAAGASATDDFYNGLEIEMRDGANAGESRAITDYDGTTKVATVAAWTTTPTAGDTYTIETKAALNVTRRGSATATTYTLGTDPVVDPLSFLPRTELEVTRVELPYASRDATDGALEFQDQASGTLTAGKRLIVPISGPELTDFLPEDPADLGLTLTIDTTTTDITTALELAIPGYAELVADYPEGGSNWIFSGANVSTTRTVADFQGGTASSGSWSNPTLSGSRSFIVFEDGIEPPEWAITLYGLQPYTVNHWYFVDGETGLTTPAFDYDRRQALLNTLGYSFYWNSATKADPSSTGSSGYQWTLNDRVSLRLWTIATADIPASGVLVRDPYSFYSPPSGLAAAMLAASNWVPWSGTITRQLDSLAAQDWGSRKYNLGGSITAAASAGALPEACEIDLDSNVVTLRLGPPARLDYRTLVGRTERSGSENIVEL